MTIYILISSSRRAGPLLAALALAACVTAEDFPLEHGFDEVRVAVHPVAKVESVWITNATEAAAIEEEVQRLVRGRMIDAETAVRVALLNNRGLQAAYADLGTSVADL